MADDKRQSKNKFLAQFNATILEQDPLPDVVTLQNKFGQTKKICFANIPRMTAKNDFWTFDGTMSDRQRNELIKIEELANKRGFKLVSIKYITGVSPLEFEDKYGTRFYAKPNSIKNGDWPQVNCKKQEITKIENKLAQYGAKLFDSEEYVNSKSTLTIVNKFGIQKKVIANNLGRWGSDFEFWSFDGKTSDYKLKEWKILNEIVSSHGGKLLSPKYIDSKTLLEVEDREGNKFFTTSISLKRGKWQPNGKASVRNADKYLKELQEIAVKYGGKLLSDKYVNNHTPLEFQDKYGNYFLATPSKIKHGSWYSLANKKARCEKKYALLMKFAKERDGKIISSEYTGVFDKIECEDKAGNRFWITPDAIFNKRSWSPFEVGRVYDPEYHYNIVKSIAEKRGGQLISTQYTSANTLLLFKDENDKEFWASAEHIKKGGWRPHCSLSYPEEITRQCFRHIFGTEFIRTKKIIKREGKPPLELDGYSEILKIAFEYQGEHHYHEKFVKKGETLDDKLNELKKIQTRDLEKQEICKKKGINLIVIPYFKFAYKVRSNKLKCFDHVFNEISAQLRDSSLKKSIETIDKLSFELDFALFKK